MEVNKKMINNFCKIVTEKSIKIAEEKYKAKVVSVVTNENMMNKLRELSLKEI